MTSSHSCVSMARCRKLRWSRMWARARECWRRSFSKRGIASSQSSRMPRCWKRAASWRRSSRALEVVEGSAEATTLPDASVDLIAVGRAMHWFDWPRAHREFQRILRSTDGRPDGWVLVASNGHSDSGGPIPNRLSQILRKWRTDSAEADTTRDFKERLQGFLDTSTWHRTTLQHSMTVDFPTLLGYAESLSAIPRPGERGYDGDGGGACARSLRSISRMGCWSRR